MNQSKHIFFDTEFTGLHQNTTLISVGFISDCGKTFYAEFNDYDKKQVDDWIANKVIAKLHLTPDNCINQSSLFTEHHIAIQGSSFDIGLKLKDWLKSFTETNEKNKIIMVGDVCQYDWVLICELFGGSMSLPANVYYAPYDIASDFYKIGDVDVDRHDFVYERTKKINEKLSQTDELMLRKQAEDKLKHNALHDAILTKKCFEKLQTLISNKK